MAKTRHNGYPSEIDRLCRDASDRPICITAPRGISPDKCDATLETVKMMIKLVAISKLM